MSIIVPSSHTRIGAWVKKNTGGKKSMLFLTFGVLVANPKKLLYTLHGGQFRSWSAEQGKENKIRSLAAYPPAPPTLLVRRK